MTIIYLAGPMRGYRYYNFLAFQTAADDLRLDGFVVVSPAELDLAEGLDPMYPMEEQGFSREEAMRRDIRAILNVHGMGFLPGSGASPGARAEFEIAKALGLLVGLVEPRWDHLAVRWEFVPRSYAQIEDWMDGETVELRA